MIFKQQKQAMQTIDKSSLRIHEKLNEFRNTLQKVKLLVENEDVNAIDSLYLLLQDVEDTFRRNSIEEYIELASFRTEILASQVAFDRKVPLIHHQLEAVYRIIPSAKKTIDNVMKPLERKIQESQIIIRSLLHKAYDSNMIQWNDGLNFPDFIHALWRLFLKHENFKESTKNVLERIPEADALQILAREVNLTRSSR